VNASSCLSRKEAKCGRIEANAGFSKDMNRNALKPNSPTGMQDSTPVLKIFDRLIDQGEIIWEDADNMNFCGDESIWYACSYIGEAEAVGDRWSLEVLHFLEDEFGNDSTIYINMRRILQVPCYAPYDEIENIKNCLDVLRAERHNLIARML
jgi:hypothetical protein